MRGYDNYQFCNKCEESGKSKLNCAIDSYTNKFNKSGSEYLENDIYSYKEHYCKNTVCDSEGIRINKEVDFINYNCGYRSDYLSRNPIYTPIITTTPSLLDALFFGGGIEDGFSDFFGLYIIMLFPFSMIYAILLIIGLIISIKKQNKSQ